MYYIAKKTTIFWGTNARNPEPAWLANQNSGFVETFIKRIANKNKLTFKRFFTLPKMASVSSKLHINYSLRTELRPEERTRNISVHTIAFQVISGCFIVQ